MATRETILEIIKNKHKHYSVIIKKNSELSSWVNQNSLSDTEHWPTKIWSAVNQKPTKCDNNQDRQITRWKDGLAGCGPASVCECTRKSISQKVSETKLLNTTDDIDKINTKRLKTMIEKYGVMYNSQRLDLKNIWQQPKIPAEALSKLTDKIWLENEYITKQRSSVDIAKELGVYYSTVASYCSSHGFAIRQRSSYSMTEVEIQKYIHDLEFSCESDRTVLGNKEIDLYVREKNFGIEVNGLYWHSYNPHCKTCKPENSLRHVEKTKKAELTGVQLIHITDWEWNNKQDIVKSMIRSKLGVLPNKISARKCKIRRLSTKEAKIFFNENHLQGFIASQLYLGLDYQNEIVMAVSVGKSRYKKAENIIELYRLVSAKDTSVVGGGSKLLSALKNYFPDVESVVSYCDRSKSNGNGYKQMGFELIGETGNGYFWTEGNEMISRYKCTKSKLKNWLKSYDPNKSESQNMFDAKYRRFWDCGNLIFKLTM